MGTLAWKGGTLFHALIFICCAIVHSNDSGQGCDMLEQCWDKYEKANAHYQADVPGVANRQLRECAVLRTYNVCLSEGDGTACAGSLIYQGTKRELQRKFAINNCSLDGPVYPDGPEPPPTPPSTPCKFKGRPIYAYCSLFGDPHLVTFNGAQATCKLEGAWPLIDNDFLTVQVTNSPLSVSTRAATVTQKVTVLVKGSGSSSPSGTFCGSRDSVFYLAEVGSLPTTFTDGMKEHGAYNSIQVKVVSPGQQVEIYIRYIDATVTVRQINNEYLSVGIRLPEIVLNDSIHNPDKLPLRQLCVENCPASEKVDILEMLANISAGSSVQKSSYLAAQQKCRDENVTDFYFDSCVFDLIMTGEPLFSSMASSAYLDVKKYASRHPRFTNRTKIVYGGPSVGGQQVPGTDSNSAAVRDSTYSSLLFTLLFVYIMHINSLCT